MAGLAVAACGGAGFGAGELLRRQVGARWPASAPRVPAWLVPGAVGLAWAGCALRFGWSLTALSTALLLAGALTAAAVDIEHLILPRLLVWPTGLATAAVMVVAATRDGAGSRLGVAALSGAALGGALFAVHAVHSRWLGFGDVRLGAVLGLGLGWIGAGEVIVAAVVANLLGVAVLGTLIVLRHADRSTRVPYGAFLTVGAVVAAFAGATLTAAARHGG